MMTSQEEVFSSVNHSNSKLLTHSKMTTIKWEIIKYWKTKLKENLMMCYGLGFDYEREGGLPHPWKDDFISKCSRLLKNFLQLREEHLSSNENKIKIPHGLN